MLSSSLSLALLTGQPVYLTKIRARRPKPNLQPQHLAAVRAAAAISGAEVWAHRPRGLGDSKVSSAHRRVGLNAKLETKRGSCHPSSLGVFVVHYACSQEAINEAEGNYDHETDTLVIVLRDQRIGGSDEIKPGVIAGFGYGGSVVRFEVLRASQVVEKTKAMQFAVSA